MMGAHDKAAIRGGVAAVPRDSQDRPSSLDSSPANADSGQVERMDDGCIVVHFAHPMEPRCDGKHDHFAGKNSVRLPPAVYGRHLRAMASVEGGEMAEQFALTAALIGWDLKDLDRVHWSDLQVLFGEVRNLLGK